MNVQVKLLRKRWCWQLLHLKQNFKVFMLKFLCDGQGADRHAILYKNRPEVIKLFFMLNSTDNEIFPAHKC